MNIKSYNINNSQRINNSLHINSIQLITLSLLIYNRHLDGGARPSMYGIKRRFIIQGKPF